MATYALPGGLAVFVVGTLLWSLAEIIEGPTMFAYPGQAGPERLRAATSAPRTPCSASEPPSAPSPASPSGPPSATRYGCSSASVLALVPGWYGINTRRESANVASD